ncbi:MAG TPA: hypothetical protein VMR70_04230 [Flavisolibacter sp.]|nr:hypothetical protein [Flavisolibacter sp.]
MKGVLVILLLAGLTACDNPGTVEVDLDSAKKEADTLVNKIKNSEVVDSIRSKGGKILDSVKSKGGKLIDKTEDKVADVRNDSTNK